MARRIKITAGILNISLHPHSRDIYLQFFGELFRLRKPTHIFGDRYGMLSTLDTRRSKEGVYEGIITTFTKVELSGSWFNATELKEANDSEVAEVNIPANLFPNARTFYFEWDANNHRLYYQQYSDGSTLTANSAKRFFSNLVTDLGVTKDFGLAKVSLIQASTGLDKLFALKKINEIHITLLKPNPDIFSDDFEEKIEAELEKAHVRKMTVSYDAEPRQSIVPTEDIRVASEAALESGKVEVIGRDESGAVRLSTEKFPVTLHDRFDPDVMTAKTAFQRLVHEWKSEKKN